MGIPHTTREALLTFPYCQSSPLLLSFIRSVEGEKLVAYRDTNGTWTIGVGHTGPDVTPGLRITPETSTKLLQSDLAHAAAVVSRAVRVTLTEPQWAALVSFVFNVGEGAFLSSTLLRVVNDGRFDQVPTQLRRWTKETINGRKVINKGLENRREREVALWETPA